MELTTHPDSSLLSEFLAAQSAQSREAAFSELVRRHAPMVLGVCRRVLNSSADAEDAAQAVFLTLAHKAGTLDRSTPLSGWLHRLAWQVALDARRRAFTRTRHEREAAQLSAQTESSRHNREWETLRPELDDALNALPEKYRLPILLHHLKGHTQAETAELLREKPGTVSMHLNRGREMLRERLVRRGVLLSAGTLGALISSQAQATEIPLTFITGTSKTAGLIAAGNAAAGVVSTNVTALTQGAMNMLFYAKMKTAAVVLFSVAAITGTGFWVMKAQAQENAPQERPKTSPVATPAPKPNGDPSKQPTTAEIMQRKVSFEFIDTPLSEAVAFLQKMAGKNVTFKLAPELEKMPINLRVTDMKLETALEWIARLADGKVKVEGNVVSIEKGAEATKKVEEDADAPWKVAMRKALERKISFEFVDTPFVDTIAFLKSLTKVNFIIDPKVVANNPPAISLKVSDMNTELALKWILRLADLEYDLRNQAVYITSKGNLAQAVELSLYDIGDLTADKDKKLTPNTVADQIRQTIAPETWDAAKGTSIEERGGKLVIMNSPAVHKQIDEFLGSLREKNDPGRWNAMTNVVPDSGQDKAKSAALTFFTEKIKPALLVKANPQTAVLLGLKPKLQSYDLKTSDAIRRAARNIKHSNLLFGQVNDLQNDKKYRLVTLALERPNVEGGGLIVHVVVGETQETVLAWQSWTE